MIADLHVHSHLSRATSKQCSLEGLHEYAQRKGVTVVGTGDFTHPEWFAELEEKLEPSAPGLFRLRPELAAEVDTRVPASCRAPVHFMLTGEISSIYKRDGSCRKVHSLLLAPDLGCVRTINTRLDALGNIKSDGRPILGLDPRILLDIALEASPDTVMIPAHIWTPWFSMLGSKSGFDSAMECFGDLEEHIFAVETGLSSDPPMNWRVSSLDRFALVSNSDLHSPDNLGRNANLFHCEPDYFAMRDGLRAKDPMRCGGTIELYPEEGKYHLDGHRKCDVCLEPEESLALDGLCPVCGKPLVLGVLHRVVALADRPKGGKPADALPCEYIIPLRELLSEIHGCGPKTKKVTKSYECLLATHGPELGIVRGGSFEEIENTVPLMGEAIRRVRAGEVIRQGGYDGEYGAIRVFNEGEMDRLRNQGVFFSAAELAKTAPSQPHPAPRPGTAAVAEGESIYDAAFSGCEIRKPTGSYSSDSDGQFELFSLTPATLQGLTPEQSAAASADSAPTVIVAGPGTGKTRTLTHRIAYLIEERAVDPRAILAVTFTNRAAREMRERLEDLLGKGAKGLTVCTFHSFCLDVLRRHSERVGLAEGFELVDQDDALSILRERIDVPKREATEMLGRIAAARAAGDDVSSLPGAPELAETLRRRNAVELDAIIPLCLELLDAHAEVAADLGFSHVCVDEYQDVNRPQYELVRRLSPSGRGLHVIGDPDQAIYGFRGADVGYFLQFERDFPDAVRHELSTNFRSSNTIVAAAGGVIAPGRSAMSVCAESARTDGVSLVVHTAPTVAAEAEYITHEIEKWIGGSAMFSVDSDRVGAASDQQVGLRDVAVLVRLRALIKPIADAIRRLGLPVQCVGDDRLCEQAGMKKLIRALRKLPVAEAMKPAIDVLGSLTPDLDDGVLEDALRLAARHVGTLTAFLDRLLLGTDAERYDADAERVSVLTLHAAKGLEFPIVFIAGCEDGLMPFARPGDEPDIEEERRLFYVGMTRAERVLYLTRSRKRTLFGESRDTQPSPFLDDLPDGLFRVTEAKPGKRRPQSQQLEFAF